MTFETLRRFIGERLTVTNFLLGLVSSLVLIFFAVMLHEGSENLFAGYLGVTEQGVTKKYEVLKLLGVGVGGVLLALQALASYTRAKAMEDAARAQAKAAQAQADATKATEHGQRQERMKNAIEHLGHTSVSVRLGGAYELFHLAQDTENLRKTVLDILCAHMRQTTGGKEYREKHNVKPSEEIQSLLTLLFVQEYQVFEGCQANLQGIWLQGATLRGATLRKADLREAKLQVADLRGADLQEATLLEADLREAILLEANLQNANLQEAKLQEAKLQNANLQKAKLQNANLQNANLLVANLQRANLVEATLQEANLVGAKLLGAKLLGADLQEADLREAIFLKADLDGANLRGAILPETDSQGRDLSDLTTGEASNDV